MKHIRKFNESIKDQIYNQILADIKDCFLEFEDNGWHWETYFLNDQNKFICKMLETEEEYKHYSSIENINWTGKIDSGKITWFTKDLKKEYSKVDITEGSTLEEAEDFLVAIKRFHDENGLDFEFSYNNIGGQKKIIILGNI